VTVLAFLRSANFTRYRITAFKVLMNIRVLALLGLLFFTFFSIGWDTVLRPNLELLKQRDDRITQVQRNLSEKDLQRRRISDLQDQLKNLQTQLVPIPLGNSATVVAVSESAELLHLAQEGANTPNTQNKAGDNASEELPKPHNSRENVSLTATTSDTVTLAQEMAPPQTVPNVPSTAAPNLMPAPAGPPPTGSGGKTQAEEAQSQQASPNILQRFDYNLKATGTYPALMDLINRLALRKKLVKINQVLLVPSATHQDLPSAADYPDFPVKLDMTVSISLYLYAAPGQ
jgi:hypothetical protein